MFSETTTAILDATLGSETPEVVIAHGAVEKIKTILNEHDFTSPLIITDRNIYQATGECAGLVYPHYIFELPVRPDVQLVETALNVSIQADVLIAFGSGTINDIVKRCSYLADKAYICIPTAPSMNGYGSRNASLIHGTQKTTVTGTLPIAIVADLDVISQAPLRMIKAGLGDSMARITAEADWLLSHQVKYTPYDDRVYELTQTIEDEVFANAEKLLERDSVTIAKLMELLILGGFGMTIAGSSAPASGGEHTIAHVIEEHHGNPGEALHGEQIAYTSQIMAKIQQHLSPPLAGGYGGESLLTHHSPLNPPASGGNYEILRELALRAGLPTTPEELGWQQSWVNEAIKLAPTSRDRYGYLNL